MGVHICKITIRNLRNFREVILDPFPARAVVVGENGVGKSNLLHALRLVLDPTLPDAARQLRAEDVWEGHAGLAAGVETAVEVELQGYDHDDDAKAVTPTGPGWHAVLGWPRHIVFDFPRSRSNRSRHPKTSWPRSPARSRLWAPR